MNNDLYLEEPVVLHHHSEKKYQMSFLWYFIFLKEIIKFTGKDNRGQRHLFSYLTNIERLKRKYVYIIY